MEDALIAAVFEREPLWDPANELHKNAIVLKKIWEELSMELQKDVKTLKARWKNMRAYFFKEHQKIQMSRNTEGGDKACTSTWQYYDQLLFLNNKTQSEHSESNDEMSFEEPQNHGTIQTNLVTETIANHSQTFQRRIRTTNRLECDQMVQIKRKKLVILDREGVKETSDDLLFFQSLLPYMENIPLVRKLRLRSKIQDLILAELEADENELRHEVPVI